MPAGFLLNNYFLKCAHHMLDVFSTENISIHRKILVTKTGSEHRPTQTTTNLQKTTTNDQINLFRITVIDFFRKLEQGRASQM